MPHNLQAVLDRIDLHCESSLAYTERSAYQPSRMPEFVGYLRRTLRSIQEEVSQFREVQKVREGLE